jgi:hypothetical protein
MMSISPFGHKAVGDLSGVSETYSHKPHSPLIEPLPSARLLMMSISPFGHKAVGDLSRGQ